VPPRSGRLPIKSFCVESGRWRQRGSEDVAKFSESNRMVNSKELKMAAKHSKDQGQVWKKVSEAQEKLAANAQVDLSKQSSRTSLQQTLEHEELKKALENHIKAFSSILKGRGKSDVIGFAFAINGKINSADVYASHALFLKLWPKLLRATATEAVAEKQKDKTFEAPTQEVILSFFADAEQSKATGEDVTAKVRAVTRESEENLLFDCEDKDRGRLIHRNYLKK
jgi:hypothetical protein